jgi:hypothetical protein
MTQKLKHNTVGKWHQILITDSFGVLGGPKNLSSVSPEEIETLQELESLVGVMQNDTFSSKIIYILL